MVGATRRAVRPIDSMVHGAGEGSRTPDLPITNRLLYQLSYAGLRAWVILPLLRTQGSSMNDRLARYLFLAAGRAPLVLQQAVGMAVGTMAARFGKARHMAEVNLQLCMPELSATQRHELVATSIRASACAPVEIARWSLAYPDEVRRVVVASSGVDLLEAALKTGEGVMILSPHVGSWGLPNIYAATLAPITVLYRNQGGVLDAATRLFTVELQSRLGVQLATSDAAGLRRIAATLRHGGMVGLLPDQAVRGKGALFADFFGRPATMPAFIPKLLLGSKVAVLFAWSKRLPRAQGYAVHYLQRPLPRDDLQQLAEAINRGIEQCILANPEQYIWGYRRFRRQPPGMRSPY